MKRKGFTLIELLAVIVILAIIALIAVPAVLNIIEDSRKGAAEASARNIISAAKTYHMQQSMKGSSIDNINLEEDVLKYDGNQASKGYIVFDEDGKATSKMYINGYCVEVKEDGKVISEKVEAEDCVVETDELKGTAYALVLDNSANEEDNLPLIFVRSETEIKAGDTYNSDRYGSIKVLGAYTGFETEVYSEYKRVYPFGEHYPLNFEYILDTPWSEYSIYITSVIAEDKVRFASLEGMFSYYTSMNYADVGNIDVSKNTSLFDMFSCAARWMEWGDLIGNYLPDNGPLTIVGLEKWDTSNITNMGSMFTMAQIQTVGDITGWDTSKVTNMANMFGEILYYGDESINVSNWNVDNVTDYYNFGYEEDIIAPNWKN